MKPLLKFLSLLATASLLIAMLAACGATTTEESTVESSSDTSVETTESDTEASAEGVDYIYINGLVYTEDEAQPWVTCFAVDDSIFVYVGDESDELWSLQGENTVVIDLDGQMVTPNLIDAHTHVATVATTNWYTDFPDDVYELNTILDYIQTYCEAHSVEEAPFIYFEYYPSDLFDTNGPQKELLDEIVSDRPILVEDFSDHACWVNSVFLELIGAYDLTEEDYGYDNWVRDENGELTGWVLESVWKYYVEALYDAIDWYPEEDLTVELMSIVTDDLKSWGVTAVFNAYLELEMELASIAEMDAAGELNMYYRDSVVLGDISELDECLEYIHYLNDTYGNNHIAVDTLKIFYDGTNELGDSALVDGLIDDPDEHGYLMMDLEETIEVIRRCNEEGIDVHFHLVGDLAFRQVCDATEALLEELGSLDIQVEMCHCELINEADYTRPAELGIIINWTPHWSGGYFGEASLQYLGQERYDSMYQFNPIIQSGGIVTFGSDIYSMYEENRANPYFGMQIAMTRIDIEYPLDSGARASEEACLSLVDLLKGYTINAAIQLRIDDITGSIEVGKYANFNVYAENLFEVDVEEFQYVMPVTVVFEGNVIN